MTKKVTFLLLSLFIITSCDALKTLTSGETDLDNEFFATAPNIQKDLRLFWRFEEATGSSKKDFVSGAVLNDTTSENIPRVSGVSGSAVNCTNAVTSGSAFLNSGHTFSQAMTDSYAFSFWIYLDSDPSGGCADTRRVIEYNTGFINLEDLDCNATTDFQIRINGTDINFNDVTTFGSGRWRHFALNVFEGGNSVELYVDGNFVASNGIAPDTISPGGFDVCSDATGGVPLNGKLDSLGVWNRTLTSDEIVALSRSLTGLE